MTVVGLQALMSIELQRQRLEIGGLGQAGMYRMVERRAGAAQDAAGTAGIAQAAAHLLGEQRRIDEVRAGGDEEEAAARGADAVIAFRFDTSELGGTWTEICAYGTAVKTTPV